ncbi:hypothetical protein DFH11DRAFT_1709697 [Phellopilus nigrolimitatus]|nr:hypothetical protein DFH11DRAFT_1709697 [Phellopilus nigrolimitatus]
MDKEIKYFWRSPWKFVSLIYFANRYLGLLGVVSGIVVIALPANEPLRLGLSWVSSLSNYMTILLIDYILLMRVLALYNQEKRMTVWLRTLFGLEAFWGLGLLVYGVIYAEISVGSLAEGVTICLTNRSPKLWGRLSWVIPMLYAIILMVLALRKAAQHWREFAGFSEFSLFKVLIQDQAIYFILVIFCNVMGILADKLFNPNSLLANLLSILAYPRVLCVLGSHLLVHLKEAGERGANEGTSYSMRTTDSIGFS